MPKDEFEKLLAIYDNTETFSKRPTSCRSVVS